MSPFHRLGPRASTIDACSDQLRDAVLAGQFAPGSTLPPERRLAEALEVNRVSVRGALARLVGEGLLTVRQGSGYRVRDFRQRGGPELLPALARHAGAEEQAGLVGDLLEVRRGLARVVLSRLAYKPARPKALGQVARAIDAFESLANAGAPLDELAEADLGVLAAVVDATGSTAFRLLLNPVSGVVLALPGLQAAMFHAPAENVAAWRLLLAWLAQPSAEAVEPILSSLAERDRKTAARVRAAELKKGRRS